MQKFLDWLKKVIYYILVRLLVYVSVFYVVYCFVCQWFQRWFQGLINAFNTRISVTGCGDHFKPCFFSNDWLLPHLTRCVGKLNRFVAYQPLGRMFDASGGTRISGPGLRVRSFSARVKSPHFRLLWQQLKTLKNIRP